MPLSAASLEVRRAPQMIATDTPNRPPEQSADEARLRVVLADLPLGIVISGPTGELRICNRAALELLGVTEAELGGNSPPLDPARSVVHEDGSAFPPETQPLAVAIATERPVHNIVMGIYNPERRQRTWLLANAEPQRDDCGIITQIVCTYSDITERRGFEARLAVADRLAAMGTLTSGIAHEINNPLAYILANIAYADSELAEPESLTDLARVAEIRHAILEARDGAHRVRDIVSEMRTLARGEAPNGPISARRVLDSAVAAVASEIRSRARLVLAVADLPPVNGDEARLGQVFINLLLNAADAIVAGAPSENEIAITTSEDDQGSLIVEVRDTGVGIPLELHQRIFDPFFTTKPVGRGRGLGLVICHHIITDLGGTISVESAPDRGSVFRVTLPAASAGAQQSFDLARR
jgi:two-component system NtrC family sensor kinase